MPTTIPERDEEKEFIQHQLWKLFGKEGTEQLYLEDVKHCFEKVAAFSARRAREKAIEDFKALLDYVEDIGENHIQHARKTVPDALTLIRKLLKSQPQ